VRPCIQSPVSKKREEKLIQMTTCFISIKVKEMGKKLGVGGSCL
jgi:hypothetical protein